MTKIENGETVWFRGRFSAIFSVRGVIEEINCRSEDAYGIRLENGNFVWACGDQIKNRPAAPSLATKEPQVELTKGRKSGVEGRDSQLPARTLA